VPIGAILDFYGTILPHGHEWPDGGSLNLTDFVELVAVIGATKPDLRGRVVAGMDDIGGNDASRLIDFIDGNTLGGVAGTEGVALTVNQLAQHSHSVAYGSPIGAAAGSDVTVLQSGSTVTGNQGATQAHLNLQPTMVMGKIIVAE
jgi:microcystin-dependent protein